MARGFGIDVLELSAEEVATCWPLLRTDDVVGAVHLPRDGVTNPVDTTMALARGARQRGVVIREEVEVVGFEKKHRRVTRVLTTAGEIETEVVVNCAGIWAHALGRLAGVSVPLHAAEHYYLVTEPIPALEKKQGSPLATLRDPDGYAYYRGEVGGKLLVGFFEAVAKPWGVGGIPKNFSFGRINPDLGHLEPMLEAMVKRVPTLEDTGIELVFAGPESFTPDDQYLLGEAPELDGFYVAAGFNSIGIQSAGGVGKVLAEWIDQGEAPIDLSEVDIARTQSFQGSSSYLHDRTIEGLGLLYAMHWPYRQFARGREVRRSPLHDRLVGRRAVFGELAGWERPNWYAPPGVAREYRYSYGRQNWFEHSADEHRAARTGVALFDQSSFAKLLVQGPDAAQALNWISANQIDTEPGKVVYTQWLNSRGGIEADLTVTRLDEEAFFVVGYAASQRRDAAWLRRNVPSGLSVTVTDVTSAWAVLGVMGPDSRDFLHGHTTADLSEGAFPYGDSRLIEIGSAIVRASRVSYVGELGWELYVPTEFATGVFDTLVGTYENEEASAPQLAGYHAMASLRLEKGYREWGHDITPDDTPLEAGLGFATDLEKPFLGREALLELRERCGGKSSRLERRLVQFALEKPEPSQQPLLYGDEPIWRSGTCVGRITSGAFGHTVDRSLGMGWVEHAEGVSVSYLREGEFEIEVAGERFPATAQLRPFLR